MYLNSSVIFKDREKHRIVLISKCDSWGTWASNSHNSKNKSQKNFSKFFGNNEGMFFNYCENFIKLKIKHYAIVT